MNADKPCSPQFSDENSQLDALDVLKTSRVILDTDGQATLDALRVREGEQITYVRDPQAIPAELPNKYFEEGTTAEYRALVREKLIAMLEAAKPEQMGILAEVNRECHLEALEDENVKELKEIFGDEVYRLAKNLEWGANLCEGDVPSRLTPEFIRHVHDLGLEVAHFLNSQLKDPAFAAKVKDAFASVADKGVIRPEKWEEIKDMDPVDFVNNLYSYLGVHIGFQGLQHDELDRLKYPDLMRIRDFMLAGKGDKEELTNWTRWIKKWMPSQTDMRSLDTMVPEVYITFDKGLFHELSGKEQLAAFEELNAALGNEKFSTLGAVQIFDRAMRAAIVREEDEAREIAIIPNRIALQRSGTKDKVFYVVNYNDPENFEDRELQWTKVDPDNKSTRSGLAVGYVFPI